MGHVVFVVLHLVALLFFPVALWVTIPAHLIYGVVATRGGEKKPATAATPVAAQRKCPACAELVLRDAFRCKHCGTDIVAEEMKTALRADRSLDGLSELDVVGESHYQPAIRALAQAYEASQANGAFLTAELIREPENNVDRNAVRVEICGYKVGYLAREAAARFEQACRREFNLKGRVPTITTPAEIRGTDPLGVVLYINEGIVVELTA